jgi:hypothetical protein
MTNEAPFGRVLLEETRKAISAFLADNRKTGREPPIQLIQAFVHYIQASIYFGDQTLDELAISHNCCLASLARAARLSENITPRTPQKTNQLSLPGSSKPEESATS